MRDDQITGLVTIPRPLWVVMANFEETPPSKVASSDRSSPLFHFSAYTILIIFSTLLSPGFSLSISFLIPPRFSQLSRRGLFRNCHFFIWGRHGFSDSRRPCSSGTLHLVSLHFPALVPQNSNSFLNAIQGLQTALPGLFLRRSTVITSLWSQLKSSASKTVQATSTPSGFNGKPATSIKVLQALMFWLIK